MHVYMLGWGYKNIVNCTGSVSYLKMSLLIIKVLSLAGSISPRIVVLHILGLPSKEIGQQGMLRL